MPVCRYIDMIVCGDDPDTEPKPSPYNALKICRELGVSPDQAAMVGDTKADVGMGHAAKLGWTVGVLTGVCATNDLLPEAGHIISGVNDLLPLILPEDMRNYYAYSTDERILKDRWENATLSSGSSGESGIEESVKVQSTELVIVDLHGTLICLNSKYSKWLAHLSNR